MTKFNSNTLSASDEIIVSKYLTKYASDNTTAFTLTNKVVVDSYLNEAKKLLDNCKCTTDTGDCKCTGGTGDCKCTTDTGDCKCDSDSNNCSCTGCKCDVIVDFVNLLENIDARKTTPTPEVSEEA